MSWFALAGVILLLTTITGCYTQVYINDSNLVKQYPIEYAKIKSVIESGTPEKLKESDGYIHFKIPGAGIGIAVTNSKSSLFEHKYNASLVVRTNDKNENNLFNLTSKHFDEIHVLARNKKAAEFKKLVDDALIESSLQKADEAIRRL